MTARLRRWTLWQLPRPARVLVLTVMSGYLLVACWGIAGSAVDPHSWLVEAVFVAAAMASVEVSMRLAWPRARHDRLTRDFLGVWMLPVALLLPPVYALTAVVLPMSYVQVRALRGQPIKVAYSIAAQGLAYAAASIAHTAVIGHATADAPSIHALIGTRTDGLALLAAFAAWWVVNHLLVGTIVALTADVSQVAEFLKNREGLVVDTVDVSVGTVAAVLWLASPVALLLLLPPILLMQHQLFSGLRHAVRTDMLTDVANPQYWREIAGRELDRASASGSNLAILMVDVDHFKAVNDRYGHLTGDDVLAAAARAITQALRPRDLVGRLGGEEFGAVLAGLNLLDAQGAAERLRAEVADVRVRSDRGDWIGVTVSVGVAELSVTGGDLKNLIAAADQALYAAKSAGRNRVRVAGPGEGTVIDLSSGDAGSGRSATVAPSRRRLG